MITLQLHSCNSACSSTCVLVVRRAEISRLPNIDIAARRDACNQMNNCCAYILSMALLRQLDSKQDAHTRAAPVPVYMFEKRYNHVFPFDNLLFLLQKHNYNIGNQWELCVLRSAFSRASTDICCNGCEGVRRQPSPPSEWRRDTLLEILEEISAINADLGLLCFMSIA